MQSEEISKRRNGRNWGRGGVLAMVTILGVLAAGRAQALTPADQKELESYTLTESFWAKYKSAAGEAKAKHLKLSDVDVSEAGAMDSLDSMAAHVSKAPQVAALLQRHGLAPREVVKAGITLMRVQLADAAAQNPKVAQYLGKSPKPSQSNIDFFHAHKNEFIALQKKMDDDDQ